MPLSTLADRPLHFSSLPPHPHFPAQRHSLAPPLPGPRRTEPPLLRTRMDPRLGRRPHHFHRRGAQGDTHHARKRG